MAGPRTWLRSASAHTQRRSANARLSLLSLEDRAVPAVAAYSLVNAWGSGQQAAVAVTNPDGPALTEWRVAFDYAGQIGDVWNAQLVSHVGDHYEFANVAWNGGIPVGGEAGFGFISTSSPAPTNITVNGDPVGGGTPAVTVSVTGGSVVEGDPATPPTPGTSAGFLSTSGNQIVDAAGNSVKLAGVNWFGMESTTFAPHGLWTRGYKEMMDQMKELGFNVIRLPISSELLNPNTVPNGIDFSKSPDLAGLNGLGVLDKVVDYAGEIGLRIFLDHHRTFAGAGADSGLWYEPGTQYTDAKFGADWQFLAARYAGDPTIIGADLHNEPHGAATWGSGNIATDWRLAAERAGNAILAVNPDWLIIVEGVESGPSGNYWWGGNLSAAGQFPVRLAQSDKLVYSPHDYPSTVFEQQWFNSPDYPNNLNAIWDANWGYLFQDNIAPVLLGEFGTKLDTASDQVWLDRLTDYLAGDFDGNGTNDLPPGAEGPSWTFWSWNPNSGDTGGILADDWRTVRTDKLALIESIQYPLLGNGGTTGSPPSPGNAVTFTVRLSAANSSPVSVAYTTQGGTATAGVDYTSVGGTLTFAPGETVRTITVPVTTDTLAEPDEAFTLVLTNPTGATLGTGTATGTIIDDDEFVPPPPPPPVTPTVSIEDVTIDEGDGPGNATFTVRLSEATTQPVTVNFATQDGTAIGGSDFTATNGLLTFAPGEVAKTIIVPVLGDTAVEPDETFAVVLTGPSGAALGANAVGTGTLRNDDTAPPPPPPPTGSGTGTAALTVGSSWAGGFIGNVAVTNNGTTAWTDWTVSFDAEYEITNIWGAEIVSRVGTRYTVKAESWNRNVAPGGSPTFGFQASLPPMTAMTLGDPTVAPII